MLGYPKGLSGGGLFPIWKRATLTTEPAVNIDGLPKMLIDIATREGMSGSPVFAVNKGMYQTSNSLSISPGGGTRFLGIYSGRNTGKTEIEAQLGFVWKEDVIKEIIEGQERGESSFEMNEGEANSEE